MYYSLYCMCLSDVKSQSNNIFVYYSYGGQVFDFSRMITSATSQFNTERELEDVSNGFVKINITNQCLLRMFP